MHNSNRQLTPEEDSVADPEDADEEIDDLLPADLWYRTPLRKKARDHE
jgi:hypothetical protein